MDNCINPEHPRCEQHRPFMCDRCPEASCYWFDGKRLCTSCYVANGPFRCDALPASPSDEGVSIRSGEGHQVLTLGTDGR